MAYSNKTVGSQGSFEYRVYFYQNGSPVSPLHDIPLWVDKEKGLANMVVEIPRGQRAKLEIGVAKDLNPIGQDVKKGALRYIHDPYTFNYGAFPQTWENPYNKDSRTDAFGDNDPIDVCEIGSVVHNTGDVITVKILGVWAMIDAGETDWKILVIDVNDPEASKYNTHSDVPKEKVEKVFTFLRDYKIPAGDPPNKFGFNDELRGRDLAIEIVEETHEFWNQLASGEIAPKGDKHNVAVKVTACLDKKGFQAVSKEEAEAIVVNQFKTYLGAAQ